MAHVVEGIASDQFMVDHTVEGVYTSTVIGYHTEVGGTRFRDCMHWHRIHAREEICTEGCRETTFSNFNVTLVADKFSLLSFGRSSGTIMYDWVSLFECVSPRPKSLS